MFLMKKISKRRGPEKNLQPKGGTVKGAAQTYVSKSHLSLGNFKEIQGGKGLSSSAITR